jgi:predicted nucleic-acid-binding protein
MPAVDTNVLIRLIVRDHPQQTSAANDFIQAGAWVSLLTLAEAVWVLGAAYNLQPAGLATAVEMLLDHRDLAVQDPDTVAQALSLFRSRPALGFSDCLILEVARKAGQLPLGTFDRALAKSDGAKKLS